MFNKYEIKIAIGLQINKNIIKISPNISANASIGVANTLEIINVAEIVLK